MPIVGGSGEDDSQDIDLPSLGKAAAQSFGAKSLAVSQSLYVAKDASPDRQADVIRLSRELKVPSSFVERRYDELKVKTEPHRFPQEKVEQGSPGLSRFMQNPENSKLVKDDAVPLSIVESRMADYDSGRDDESFIGALVNSYRGGSHNLASSTAHIAAATGMMSIEDAARMSSENNARARVIQGSMPQYHKDFLTMAKEEGGDINRAALRFSEGWDMQRRGQVMNGLEQYALGTIQTPYELADLIGTAALSHKKGLALFMTEMLPYAVPAMAGGAAGSRIGGAFGLPLGPLGAKIGGIIGLGGGVFSGVYLSEYGASINEDLAARGYDTSNYEDMLRAYRDPALMKEIRDRAGIFGKAGGTAAVEAAIAMATGGLTAGLIGSGERAAAKGVVKAVAGAEKAAAGGLVRAGRVVKGVALETVGEGVGEGVGQAMRERDLRKIDFGEVGMEMMGGFSQSVVTSMTGDESAHRSDAGKSARSNLSADPVKAAEEATERFNTALKTVGDVQALSEASEAMIASKTSERSPEKMEEFINEVSGEDGEVLFQSDQFDDYWRSKGISPDLMAEQILGDDVVLYHEAKETGGKIRIPTNKYMAKIGATEHFAGLAPIMQTREKGASLAESVAETQSYEETMKELSGEVSGAKAQVEDLKSQIASQVVAAGRSQEEANTAAELISRAFMTISKRAGMTTEQFFERVRTTISGVKADQIPRAIGDMLRAPREPGIDEISNEPEVKEDFTDVYKEIDKIRAGKIPAARAQKGKSLVQYLRSKGGIDASDPLIGDVKQFELKGMVKKKGLGLGAAAKAAFDAGYIKSDAINDLLDAMQQDSNSGGVFLPADIEATASANSEREGLLAFEKHLKGIGVDVNSMTNEQVIEAMKSSENPALSETAEPFSEDLFQGKNFGKRGKISIKVQDKIIHMDIKLLEKADHSTLMHEIAHAFQRVVLEMSNDNNSTPEIKAMADDIRKWLGAKDGAELTEDQKENFAIGFEKYLQEGRAPSEQLRAIFTRLRQWMLDVYKGIIRQGIPLTDDARNVFDMMLASDIEIERAANEVIESPMIQNPEAYGLEQDFVDRIKKSLQDTRRMAREIMDRKVFKEHKRTGKGSQNYEGVKAEVTAEVNANPAFVARSVLTTGKNPDGSPSQFGKLKLNRDDVVEQFGEEFTDSLPKAMFSKKGAVSQDDVAPLFGFKNGRDLILAIAQTAPINETINSATAMRMRERYGDLLIDGTLSDDALEALHNEKRAETLRLEHELLAKHDWVAEKGLIKRIAARPMESDVEMETRAKVAISRQTDRTLNPNQYKIAERQFQREAVDLFLKGDIEGAFIAKTRERFNHQMFKQAIVARERINVLRRLLRRLLDNKVRGQIGKAGGSYLDQIDAILERIEVKSVSGRQVEKRQALADWIESQEKQGITPAISAKLRNEAYRQNYRDIPYGDLMDVGTAIEHIIHIASTKNILLANKKFRELSEAVKGIVSEIEANSKGRIKEEEESQLPSERLKRNVASFFAAHDKFNAIVTRMAGGKVGGVIWESLTRVLNEAADNQSEMNSEATGTLASIFRQYSVIELAKMMTVKEEIPGISKSLSRMGQMVAVLNYGNPEGRQRLNSMGYTDNVMQVLIDRMSEKDLNFIESIFDFLESFWPKVRDLHKRATGLEPEKVDAAPFSNSAGRVIKGGYFPIKYDSIRSRRSRADEYADFLERRKRGAAMMATTKHGHRKARVEEVHGRPLRLDFWSIIEHVSDVIHDLTHYEAILDTSKILRDQDVEAAIVAHHGRLAYNELSSTIEDIAMGDAPAKSGGEALFNYMRMGMSISKMGWNVGTGLLQPLGLTQSQAYLGGKWLSQGIGKWIGDAVKMESTVKMVMDKSKLMTSRASNITREVHQLRSDLSLRGLLLGDVEKSFFYLIAKAQLVADIPTWLGGYEKAWHEMRGQETSMSQQEMEDRAVALADQAVRDAQGTGQVIDRARIQRGGPYQQIWTTFYHFFSTTYNLLRNSAHKADIKDVKSIGALAADIALLVFIPATLQMFRAGLKGDLDKDDIGMQLLKENATYAVGTMVGLRELQGIASGFTDYQGPAGTAAFGSVGRLAKQTGQIITAKSEGKDPKDEMDEAFFRALNETAGVFFLYPALQVDRTVRGLIALQEDRTDNPFAALLGPSHEAATKGKKRGRKRRRRERK